MIAKKRKPRMRAAYVCVRRFTASKTKGCAGDSIPAGALTKKEADSLLERGAIELSAGGSTGPTVTVTDIVKIDPEPVVSNEADTEEVVDDDPYEF